MTVSHHICVVLTVIHIYRRARISFGAIVWSHLSAGSQIFVVNEISSWIPIPRVRNRESEHLDGPLPIQAWTHIRRKKTQITYISLPTAPMDRSGHIHRVHPRFSDGSLDLHGLTAQLSQPYSLGWRHLSSEILGWGEVQDCLILYFGVDQGSYGLCARFVSHLFLANCT